MHNYKIFLLILIFVSQIINDLAAQQKVDQWDFVELTYKGQKSGNPFIDVVLTADFTHDDKTISVDGFYDGNGNYKIRFMPDITGKWTYVTKSNLKELKDKRGSFECVSPSQGNNGPVVVNDQFHFRYANKTPYVPVGTTCYAWLHQSDEQQELTLKTLKESPFNKIRMTIFPKYYEYNREEPALYPYEKGSDGKFDFARFNPEFFNQIEKRIIDLQNLNIEADLILFHPYDQGHWGFDRMDRESNNRYMNYVLARFSAFRNVWWSMANEYDLMKTKTMDDWENFFQIIQEKDPYNRLTSMHNGNIDAFYDHSKPYITHVSVQNPHLKQALSWKKYGKPVINDECEYEGNTWLPWGNITGRELVNRAWLGYGYGIYVGHGETFDDDSGVLWWSHGGELKGESAPRFAFLKEIMMETSPTGLQVNDTTNWIWTRFAGGESNGTYIFYFAEHQPKKWILLNVQEDKEYKAELIDTWNMTITPIEGKFKKGSTIPLVSKPYLALRVVEVK